MDLAELLKRIFGKLASIPLPLLNKQRQHDCQPSHGARRLYRICRKTALGKKREKRRKNEKKDTFFYLFIESHNIFREVISYNVYTSTLA